MRDVRQAANPDRAVTGWRLAVLLVAALAFLAGACAEPTNREPVAVTQPGSVATLLTVDSPQVGDLFVSTSPLRGQTSSPTVGYRLSAGDTVLTEGTVSSIDGQFATVLEFSDSCCTEMLLEVFHPEEAGLTLEIPLTHPDSS